MTAALAVLKAGIVTSLQDAGRAGLRAQGVPHSGALDTVALQLANHLVGNTPDEGALEMLYAGAALEARGGPVRVALACAEGVIVDAAGSRTALPAWQSATLQAGWQLRVGPIRDTAAAYLAVEGGFDVPPVLGSVSTYLRGALGGWKGRALEAGDVLPLRSAGVTAGRERRLAPAPALTAPRTLRVMIGPHEARFTRAALRALESSEYTVTPQSDRSGLRLEGAALAPAAGHDLLSEGIPPGSIQVTGAGQPVVLIGDHGTVGGYPRIATVISADIAAAGRLRIGSRVRFAVVNTDAAADARHALNECVKALTASIAPIR